MTKTEASKSAAPIKAETLRSSYTPDGQRLGLIEVVGGFAIVTRWQRITRPFARIQDAIAAFEVLEFCEGDLYAIYRRSVAVELARTRKAIGGAMARTWQVLTDAERREMGLRPVACGRKASCVRWIATGSAQ